MLRIKTQHQDQRISTYFATGKWFTFYRDGGQLIDSREASSLFWAGQNHLEFIKLIKGKEQNGKVAIIESRIESQSKKGAESKAALDIKGMEEITNTDGEECSPESYQEGQGKT
jgi:hypothetical protein